MILKFDRGRTDSFHEPNLIGLRRLSRSDFTRRSKSIYNILAGFEVYKVEFNHRVKSEKIGFLMLTYPIGVGHMVGSLSPMWLSIGVCPPDGEADEVKTSDFSWPLIWDTCRHLNSSDPPVRSDPIRLYDYKRRGVFIHFILKILKNGETLPLCYATFFTIP